MGKTKTAEGEKKIMPLISVIMGVHNSETDMLLSAVGSVLSQSVSDIELIICDDGSENGIGKTLDSIKDSRLLLPVREAVTGWRSSASLLTEACLKALNRCPTYRKISATILRRFSALIQRSHLLSQRRLNVLRARQSV